MKFSRKFDGVFICAAPTAITPLSAQPTSPLSGETNGVRLSYFLFILSSFSFLPPPLTGTPPKPNEVGSVGKGVVPQGDFLRAKGSERSFSPQRRKRSSRTFRRRGNCRRRRLRGLSSSLAAPQLFFLLYSFLLTTTKTGASVSASSGSSLFFGYPYFFSKSRPRYRNVTACARVHFPTGSKIAALLPLVMPFSTAHSTA